MKLCKLLTILVFVGSVFPRLAVGGLLNPNTAPSAYDNFEGSVYSDNWQPVGNPPGYAGDNGGFGFKPWQVLQGSAPLAVIVNPSALDGVRSLSAQRDTQAYAAGRPIGSQAYGWFDTLAQFQNPTADPLSGFYGFGLLDTAAANSGFSAHSLLSFGLTQAGGANQITIISGSQTYYLGLGGVDYNGLGLFQDRLEFLVNWETRNGLNSYTLQVTNLTANTYARFSGQLANSAPVLQLGVANFNTLAEFQNLKFDNFAFGIPEPGVAMLWLTGLGTIYALRRPWHKQRQRKA